MLHGCTQTPDAFAIGTRMNVLAEERQCLVLYPSRPVPPTSRAAGTGSSAATSAETKANRQSLPAWTREVMNRYRIDPRKVYVAGLSAGGAMAAVMGRRTLSSMRRSASTRVSLWKRARPAFRVGPPCADTGIDGRPQFRLSAPGTGNTDDRVSRRSGQDVHPRNGEQLVSQSVEHHGASSADASTERGQVPGGHAYTAHRSSRFDASVVLEHWLVHGGGHAWFGGSPRARTWTRRARMLRAR